MLRTPAYVRALRLREDLLRAHMAQHDESGWAGCLFCALRMVFRGMARSEDTLVKETASSQALREALGNVYASQARFQEGSMNDSWEAHVAILDTLQEELLPVAQMAGGGHATAVQAASPSKVRVVSELPTPVKLADAAFFEESPPWSARK